MLPVHLGFFIFCLFHPQNTSLCLAFMGGFWRTDRNSRNTCILQSTKMLGKTDFLRCPNSWQLPKLLLEFPRVPKMSMRGQGRDESVAFLTHLWSGPSLPNWTSPPERPGYAPSGTTVGCLQWTPHIRAQGGTCTSVHFSTHWSFFLLLTLGTIKYEVVQSRTDRKRRFESECLRFCIFLFSPKAWLFILFRVTLRYSRFCWCSYKSSHFQC